MRQMLVFIPIILILFSPLQASKETFNWQSLPLKKRVRESLWNEPFIKSNVTTPKEKTQKLEFISAGLHKKSCSYALITLSRYETFSRHIDFITKSSYDESNKRISLSLSHTLMPFDMGLNFKIERIKGPGLYPFQFDRGFLRGLKGEIHVSEHRGRCLFYATAHWQGPDSGINDSVFSFFSQVLGRLAFERLFRISETL